MPIFPDTESAFLRQSENADQDVIKKGSVIDSDETERRKSQSFSGSGLRCVRYLYTSRYAMTASTGEITPQTNVRYFIGGRRFLPVLFMVAPPQRRAIRN